MAELVRSGDNSAVIAEELALIGRCQQGDQQAYGVLVERYQRFAYNVAYNLVQDMEEAADLVQEAFMRAWQALPNYRAEARFSTWLYRIVHNLGLNRLEVLQRRRRMEQQEVNTEAGEDEGRGFSMERIAAPEGEQPAQVFEQEERRNFIWQQVGSLPPQYRDIIGLYYGQQLSYEEIAVLTSQPLGTVKTHLHRAKGMLRDRLVTLAPAANPNNVAIASHPADASPFGLTPRLMKLV